MASSLKSFLQKIKTNNPEHRFTKNSRFSCRFAWERTPNNLSFGVFTKNKIDLEMAKDFDFYVRGVNIPNIKIGGRPIELDDNAGTDSGTPPGYSTVLIQNSLLLPQEMNFSIDFIDTEKSFVDSFIEPWARMCASPRTSLDGLSKELIDSFNPTPLATIYIDVHNGIDSIDNSSIIRTYKISGVFPSIIDNPEFSHDNSEYIIRKVEFNFSRIRVSTKEGK